MLDVAAGLFATWKVESSAAQERNSFGLALSQVAWRDILVALQALGRMSQQDMRKLMKPGLVWQGIQRVDGDAALPTPKARCADSEGFRGRWVNSPHTNIE